jgi:hypothetical protein
MAALAPPKIKPPDTSSPRLPSVPIFFRVPIAYPHATDGIFLFAPLQPSGSPPEADQTRLMMRWSQLRALPLQILGALAWKKLGVS